MKTWISSLLLLVGCGLTLPARDTEPAPRVTPPQQRTIEAELRRGDDVCAFLCDKHRFAWAVSGPVDVWFFTDARVQARVIGPDGLEVPVQYDYGKFTVDVAANVEYELRIDGEDRYAEGEYTVHLSPPPATEDLAEVRPIPPPPTPEEEEPDEKMAARLAEITAGWSVVGEAKRVDLTKSKRKLTWKGKAGRCYSAWLVLAAGARFEDTDDITLRLRVVDDHATHVISGYFYPESRRILSVAGSLSDVEGLCAMTSGKVELDFPETGTGHVDVMLYERRTDLAALKQRALDDEADYCTACMEQRLMCQQTGHTGPFKTCKAQFKDCVRGLRVQCKP